MNILFITSSRIGDAVLSSGLLTHLVTKYPDAHITVACGPAAAPLFEAAPLVERIIVMNKRKWGGHWLDLWRDCIRWPPGWSMVVDLRGSVIAYCLLARRRRVYWGETGGRHRLYALAKVFKLSEPQRPVVWTDHRHETEAARLIPEGGPVLALGPTANWAGKIWAADNFVELSRRLTADDGGILPGARIAVFGAAGERGLARPVIEAFGGDRLIDLVGGPDLTTVAACLGRCALYIGNDSGLMHMAAAAEVPTLGLFGPSRDEIYAPWGTQTAVVRTAIPYQQLFPPGYDHRTTSSLMDSLTVDAAEAAARALWQRCQTRGGMTASLSVLVVVHNEAAQLADCLDRLSFADEIVVVLDRCGDGSRDIARRYTDHLLEGAWEIEGQRRNAGIAACTGDWLFEVDADERVSPALASEIRAAIIDAAPGYFLLPFDNYIGERLVRHGWGASWGVSATARLFSRGAKTWGDQRIHPELTLVGAQRWLKTPMEHYVDRDISDMIRRLDRYSTLRARDLRAAGEINRGNVGGLSNNVRRLFSRFFKCYVMRRGYREGGYGFLIALFAGLYPLLSYLKARYEDD